MSTLIQPNQVFTVQYGLLVTKAAATIPQTATVTLYTVAGGAVLVTAMHGTVTTVIGATATTLALGTAPTAGTAKTSGIASATAITSSEVGVWVAPGITSGAALQVAGAGGAGANAGFVNNTGPAFVVMTGTITWTTSASTTGAMKWYLSYIPLDVGASVS